MAGAAAFLRKSTPIDALDETVESKTEELRDEPWVVTLHNDPITPMEYVVTVLHEIFSLGWVRASAIMVRAHVMGAAEVGTFPAADAEKRVDAAHARARAAGWPLRLSCGPAA
jgi:ATP-dependent Clp protease adaptor protein ClpS